MDRPVKRQPKKGTLPRNVYRRVPLEKTASRSPQPSGHRPSTAPNLGHRTAQDAVYCVCGNCRFQTQDYAKGVEAKHQAGLKLLAAAGVTNTARLLPVVPSPKPLGYRSLFKLAVRPARPKPPEPRGPQHRPGPQGRFGMQQRAPYGAPPLVVPTVSAEPEVPNRFAIGLFEQGTHNVVDAAEDCLLHTEPLQFLLRDLRTELNLSPITPFDEKSHTGDLRYLAARAAHLTGEIMLTFVVTKPLKVELRRIVANLQRRGHKINSAHMNLNDTNSNAIFGAETIRLAGNERLRERVCDLDFEVGPTSFFQINPWQAINLYRRIEQIAGPAVTGAAAWDLYCGIGQISLVLARLGYRVFGIEENARAVSDATDNARKNHLEGRAEFLPARVEDAGGKIPFWAKNPELIVVNPSRRGLAETTRTELAQLLNAHPRSRFVYVSCAAETLARDLAELTKATGFTVRQIEPFDMFPQTDNMEWLAVLTR